MLIDKCNFKLTLSHKINIIVKSLHTDTPVEVIILKAQQQISKTLLFMQIHKKRKDSLETRAEPAVFSL